MLIYSETLNKNEDNVFINFRYCQYCIQGDKANEVQYNEVKFKKYCYIAWKYVFDSVLKTAEFLQNMEKWTCIL